jgi:hypothetical protein
MNIYDEEQATIWKAFTKYHLKYILVGGFAVNLHGFNRTMGGVDIWIKDDEKNRQSFKKVLIDLGYVDVPQIKTLSFDPRLTTFILNTGLELNAMTYLKGFDKEKFDACLKYATIAKIFDLEIPFLNIDQLIEAKKATFRPKDQIDILELEKIKSKMK